MNRAWREHERQLVACARCPRLREWCETVAREKRRAFRDQTYWGKPVPGFGDRDARLLIVGLAPAAHGANRTGRMFTGDGSGDWLYAALHETGFASRPTATRRGDGLTLRDVFVTASARCAPPDNNPTRDELDACAPFLDRELDLLHRVEIVVALGSIAWDTVLRRASRVAPASVPSPRPKFGHRARATAVLRRGADPVLLLGSYHPSRQNTQTGRLTREMWEAVFRETAARLSPR
ncbi:MAG TPA: uracil-DNA glycosylase [Candidatus Polarisedimenticolaceae bacterium]